MAGKGKITRKVTGRAGGTTVARKTTAGGEIPMTYLCDIFRVNDEKEKTGGKDRGGSPNIANPKRYQTRVVTGKRTKKQLRKEGRKRSERRKKSKAGGERSKKGLFVTENWWARSSLRQGGRGSVHNLTENGEEKKKKKRGKAKKEPQGGKGSWARGERSNSMAGGDKRNPKESIGLGTNQSRQRGALTHRKEKKEKKKREEKKRVRSEKKGKLRGKRREAPPEKRVAHARSSVIGRGGKGTGSRHRRGRVRPSKYANKKGA